MSTFTTTSADLPRALLYHIAIMTSNGFLTMMALVKPDLTALLLHQA